MEQHHDKKDSADQEARKNKVEIHIVRNGFLVHYPTGKLVYVDQAKMLAEVKTFTDGRIRELNETKKP